MPYPQQPTGGVVGPGDGPRTFRGIRLGHGNRHSQGGDSSRFKHLNGGGKRRRLVVCLEPLLLYCCVMHLELLSLILPRNHEAVKSFGVFCSAAICCRE